MDGTARLISSDDLYKRLGTAKAPLLIDVRRRQAFETDQSLIIGGLARAKAAYASQADALTASIVILHIART